jgi:hypothetical protein
LYKDNPADPLGMLCEEKLESVELLRHALDVIESVYTNDDLDAVKALFERSDALLDGLFLQVLKAQSGHGSCAKEQTDAPL